MKIGTLYAIGVGPGDPELITVKGARLLAQSEVVFVPKARSGSHSVARHIAQCHISPRASIRELIFPMTSDEKELAERWRESAETIAEVLCNGIDACFLTLGDPLLYSTNIFLLGALRERLPESPIQLVPGIPAFTAVSALTSFPVGVGKEPVVIVPAAENLNAINRALEMGGTVVIMKVGHRLERVIDLLEQEHAIEGAVFVAHAGMENQHIETDLRTLKGNGPETGYLSIILARKSSRFKNGTVVPGGTP